MNRLRRFYHLTLRPSLLTFRNTLTKLLILFLLQLQDRAIMIFLVAIGSGRIALRVCPPPSTSFAWGVGMLVFGSLSLLIRKGD